MKPSNPQLAIVIIGRNEGDRLKACFESIVGSSENIIYVDSGSTDNSIQLAESFSITVVSLDMSVPFSAARARNEGAERAIQANDALEFIQFIDGDCTVDDQWIAEGLNAFAEDVAIVCGRRKEKYPERSLYNQLCDIEWNTPVGEAHSCGGDFIIRADIFKCLGGFNSSVIAGEEPELCYRIREAGYRILRIDQDMTHHDANIHSFKQHWMRSVRCGYSYALGLHMHNKPKERLNLRATVSALFWGFFFPSTVLILSCINSYFLLLLLIYPLNIIKIYSYFRNIVPIPLVYSASLVVAKFSETYGILKFLKTRMFSDKHKIIEYK